MGSDRQISEMQRSAKQHDNKKPIWSRILGIACAAALASDAALPAPTSPDCDAASTGYRVALLELYTSEGCSSCPPADRFLSSLAGRGFRDDKLVALAFHVDYWDYLGWRDRFAQAAFSARQRLAADRAGARFIYTPQFLLDGRDLAQAWLRGSFAGKVAAINGEPASVRLGISQRLRADMLELDVAVVGGAPEAAQFYVAIVESGLSSEVKAGENAGRVLQHDRVVRALKGPLPAATQSLAIPLPAHWNRTQIELVAFVQEPTGGKVLQTLNMPLCGAH
jgi:hypothetical protein